MQIKIDDYLITRNKRQYIVGKPVISSKGVPVIHSKMYFTTLSGAAKYLAELRVGESEVKTLLELDSLLNDIAAKFERLFNSGFKFNIRDKVKVNDGISELTGNIYERQEYVDINYKTKTLEHEIKRLYGVHNEHGSYSFHEDELMEV